MSGPTSPTGRPGRRLRRPGATGRVIVALGVVLAVGLAGAGTYVYLTQEFGGTTLVVYTYPSLLGGLDCGNASAFQTVFGTFASAHHVRVVVDCPTGNLYATLLSQRSAPAADVVIGLDEITAPQAQAEHLLVPYAPAGLADVPAYLSEELSPQYAAVPYEYGYLALDYNLSLYNATGGAVAHASLTDFANNSSLARQLLIEDPTTDITGEEFLLWEIEYYTHVVGANWTTFWTALNAAGYHLTLTWGDAFTDFQSDVGSAVVSYSTDAAYAAYWGLAGSFNATGAWWGGSEYSWRTIYGVGIVNGTHHLTLAEQFENWFLSGTVESLLPTNEWEYPANDTVGVPAPYFAYAIPPGQLTALNNDTTPAALVAALPGYLSTWASLGP